MKIHEKYISLRCESMDKINFFKVSEFFAHLSDSEKKEASMSSVLQSNMEELKARLNLIRLLLGKPIIVTSWYRDNLHNKRVGGSATSQHLRGEAVDIKCTDNYALSLIVQKLIDDYGVDFGQIILYGRDKIRFIHLSLPSVKHKNEFLSYE